jgi:hypothetical protein
MERVIATASRVALPGALSRACGRAFDRVRLRWSLAGLGGAAAYVSFEHLWSTVLRHAGMMLLLALPVLLVAWLVIEAEQARKVFRPTRTCRRQ